MKLLVYIITNSYIHTRVIIHICNVQLVYMYTIFIQFITFKSKLAEILEIEDCRY